MSVAVNEGRKILKRRNRRSEVEYVGEIADQRGDADPVTGIDVVDLIGALERLDPDDRALLAMRFIAGFDSNELAAATGISPSGTRSRIERLLKRLREDLRDG